MSADTDSISAPRPEDVPGAAIQSPSDHGDVIPSAAGSMTALPATAAAGAVPAANDGAGAGMSDDAGMSDEVGPYYDGLARVRKQTVILVLCASSGSTGAV